jgi:hypothetical protein
VKRVEGRVAREIAYRRRGMTRSALTIAVVFTASLVLSLLMLPGVAAAQTIVVNEVMYRPWNQSTYGRYEFVEIYNYGDEDVDLSGYMLTDSQDLVRVCHFQHPLDYEGVFEIPAGTVIAPGTYLTFWHTHIPGVTDQPGNIVYDSFLYFGNLVIADGGDQVTIFTCDAGTPVIVDSLDTSLFTLSNLHNRTLERISPFALTQEASNWGYSTAPTGGQPYGGAYAPGGTPGAENSIAAF